MQTKDVMTTDVATVRPQDTIENAAKLMQKYDVGSIPVCEDRRIVGIVTDRDIALRCVAEGKSTGQAPVSEVMTTNPVTASPSTDVHEAARLMSEKQIRRLPIVDRNTLVGMVALGDLAVEPDLSDNAGDALKDISASPQTERSSF